MSIGNVTNHSNVVVTNSFMSLGHTGKRWGLGKPEDTQDRRHQTNSFCCRLKEWHVGSSEFI